MKCICGAQIPQERLEALPGVSTCIKCSTGTAKKGYMVYSHKTAPELVFIDPNNPAQIATAERAHRRSR